MCAVPVKSIHLIHQILYYRVPPFLSPAPWASRSPQPRSSVILEMTGGESQYINLWVVGEDSGEVAFTVKKTTPLRKLLRQCIGRGAIRRKLDWHPSLLCFDDLLCLVLAVL